MFRLFLFFLSFFSIAGCREIYTPDIQSDNVTLVVEALLTDLSGITTVKLTRAVPYDSSFSYIPEKNAHIFIKDNLGNLFVFNEKGGGVYENSEITGYPGRTYILSIETANEDLYESSPQTMSFPFKQDSIYAEEIVKTTYIPDAYGKFIENRQKGIETYVDLSSGSDNFPKCRYDLAITVLYSYVVLSYPTYIVNCWRTYRPGTISISSSKFNKVSGTTSKQPILFFSNKPQSYDNREEPLMLNGFLLSVVKYNMSVEVFGIYTKIVSQSTASGKLFDPLPSQISSNIKCKNHPGNIVLGFFEVSSAEIMYFRYNINRFPMTITRKDSFPDFTYEGELERLYPKFWYY